jgi:hypothetical protein
MPGNPATGRAQAIAAALLTVPGRLSRWLSLPRYRLDFLVLEIHDIAEEHAGAQAPVTPPPRNATLDRLRAALAEDPRWTRSMLAPWRPFGQYQHLIVWIDLTQPESETVIRDAVTGIVNEYLPGVTLAEMVENPL